MSTSNRYSSSSASTGDSSSDLLHHQPVIRHCAIPSDAESHNSSTTVQYGMIRERIYDVLLPRRKDPTNSTSYSWAPIVAVICASLAFILSGIPLFNYFVISKYTVMKINAKALDNCLECSSFQNVTEKTKTRFLLKYVNGLEYCCARSRDQLADLLETMIEHKGIQDFSPVMRNSMSPLKYVAVGFVNAVMAIGVVSPFHKHTGKTKELSLRTLTGEKHWVGFQRDRIVIHQDGRYLINSQFSHKIVFGRRMRFKKLDIFGHMVKRHNPRLPNNHEETLLAGFYTACEECSGKKSDHHISHLSGVFLLKRGDKISVSANGNVHKANVGNYLAILRIGNIKPSLDITREDEFLPSLIA